MTLVAADLGGTSLRCATIHDDEKLSNVMSVRLRGDASTRDHTIWTFICDTVADYANAAAGVLASRAAPSIVFSFPGPIDAAGNPIVAPTVRTLDRHLPDLRAMFTERTASDVRFLNDVSAAAWYFSERLDAERFAVVTVSSGIGAKVFLRSADRCVVDDLSYAGEIGHIVVDRSHDAPACDCGGIGHLGGIASGRGVERFARTMAVREADQFARSRCVTELGASSACLSNEAHLVPAIACGDEWAIGIVERATAPLAGVLSAMVVGAGLQAVAIMGGFAQQIGPRYAEILRVAFEAHVAQGPAHVDTRRLFHLSEAAAAPSLLGAAIFGRALAPKTL